MMSISWRHDDVSTPTAYNEFQETAGGLGGHVMSCQGIVLAHAYQRRGNSQTRNVLACEFTEM